MNKCISCGKETLDKTKTRKPLNYVSLCKEHREFQEQNKRILSENKKEYNKFVLAKDDKIPDILKENMLKREFTTSNFEVFAYYLTKREIKPLTNEEMEEIYTKSQKKVK